MTLSDVASTNRKVSTKRKLKNPTIAAPFSGPKRIYEAGELIADKYLLRELLGEGGMGAVWRAHNETLDIDVAVKLIRAEEMEAADGHQLGDRLLQEARAAARLGHPAIARVFDFGTTDRRDPFIVMELLRGEDLAEALARRGRISATKAVALLLPIAHALSVAHDKGIVHRDLKPENVYLARAEDGRTQPKLVDFGIAKVGGPKNNRLTQTGTMLGSPIYMSPEQARGDDVDHLADVWAFCVVLYEMVAGRPPFEGKNYNALLYSIIADEPAPITSFGGGDNELWELLRRGFEKDPDKRWSCIRQLGVELARWMIARGVHEDITGASLSAQWLRRLKLSGDSLASMMPAGLDSEHPSPSAAMSALSGGDAFVLGGRRVQLPGGVTRARALVVAVGAAVVGALLILGLFASTEAPEAIEAAASGPAEPVQQQVVAVAPLPTSVPDVAAPGAGEVKAEGADEGSVPRAGDPEKAKAPRKNGASRKLVRPASKKRQLKNPFE